MSVPLPPSAQHWLRIVRVEYQIPDLPLPLIANPVRFNTNFALFTPRSRTLNGSALVTTHRFTDAFKNGLVTLRPLSVSSSHTPLRKFCFVLICFVLFCLILSCLALSCLAHSCLRVLTSALSTPLIHHVCRLLRRT